jgi:3-hydroxyisobutyrate dehydrogenase
VRAGFAVRAWDHSPDKAEPLAGDGAFVAAHPGEAADGADVVLTMLMDADATLSVAAEAVRDGVERGHGDLDMAATFLTSAR